MGTLWPQEHRKKIVVNGNIVFKFVKWVGNYVLIIHHSRSVLGTIYISLCSHYDVNIYEVRFTLIRFCRPPPIGDHDISLK